MAVLLHCCIVRLLIVGQNYLAVTFQKLQLLESCNKFKINTLLKIYPLSILLIYFV